MIVNVLKWKLGYRSMMMRLIRSCLWGKVGTW